MCDVRAAQFCFFARGYVWGVLVCDEVQCTTTASARVSIISMPSYFHYKRDVAHKRSRVAATHTLNGSGPGLIVVITLTLLVRGRARHAEMMMRACAPAAFMLARCDCFSFGSGALLCYRESVYSTSFDTVVLCVCAYTVCVC